MAQLIMFRTVQGLGAGAIMPISLTIAADLFPPERRGKFMGLFGTVFALSSIFGPTLGGVLSSGGHWGWIFLINLPIGLVALAAIAAGLKENVKSDGKRYIDWFGALTLSGAIVSVLVALVLGGSRYVWGSVQTIGLFVLGALLLALFVRIEMRAQDPLVPLHLFRLRAITFGNIAGFWMSAGMYGAIAYMPLFVQNVIGVSPAAAGYMLTPLMLSTVVTSTTSGRMMAVWSYRAILVGSLLLMLAGFVLLGTMGTETSIAQAIAYMVVTGLGMGAVYPALGTAAANAVDWQHRGVAASSSQFCRSIGGAIGVSVLGSLLTQHMAAGAHADKAALSHALDHLFLLGAAFVAISLLASLWLGNARAVATAKR
jgi:EmrB/QacA subfamily drug resistance transporter